MSDQVLNKNASVKEVYSFFVSIMGPESNYFVIAMIYGIGISLLSLALPISVQMLVNTVANTGLTYPLVLLSMTLFGLLAAAGMLNALRIHLMDLFQRRFYARMVSEIALRSIYAINPFFQDYNNGALFNRYFDIIIVQKNTPNLLIGGFTIVLQAAVGFILVSMYHPLFLALNLVVLLLIWLIWLVWGSRAIKSAIQVSHKKHAAAAWIEGLGASNGFFKSERHITEALERTDAVTGDYITAHRKHFRHHYAQTICFVLLYASASAILLGLGGLLVIRGELSLGQLVAAELVMTGVFYGISQLGIYLAYFYELCASLDELSLFYDVRQENIDAQVELLDGTDGTIEFVNARGEARGRIATLNFKVPSGARVLATADSHGVQRELTTFLKGHVSPSAGYVAVGGQDINNVGAHELRQQIIVLDRPNAIEMTIREYLRLSCEDASSAHILRALRVVGLDPAISELEDGLETRVAATGWPLTITETMQLKLAAAIIARPRVLVLGELYDTVDGDNLRGAFDLIQEESETTVVYFSTRDRDLGFNLYLYLGHQTQRLFEDYDVLCDFASSQRTLTQGLATNPGATSPEVP